MYCNVNYRLVRTEEAINGFNDELRSQDRNTICEEMQTDVAYNNFIEIFTSLYNKHCPIRVSLKKKKK